MTKMIYTQLVTILLFRGFFKPTVRLKIAESMKKKLKVHVRVLYFIFFNKTSIMVLICTKKFIKQ